MSMAEKCNTLQKTEGVGNVLIKNGKSAIILSKTNKSGSTVGEKRKQTGNWKVFSCKLKYIFEETLYNFLKTK